MRNLNILFAILAISHIFAAAPHETTGNSSGHPPQEGPMPQNYAQEVLAELTKQEETER